MLFAPLILALATAPGPGDPAASESRRPPSARCTSVSCIPRGAYTLDADRTLLLVLLRPDDSRILSGLSHRHVIRATRPTGTVQFDPDRPEACRIEVQASVEDLEVDAPDMRRKVGYDDVLDEDDREDVRENMLDEDQLHAAKHRTIDFVADRCEPMVDGRMRLEGSLTVRGVSQPLQIPMKVTYLRGKLTARGEFVLTHGAFEFEPYSAALGALANDDWLKFMVEVVADRRVDRERTTRPKTATKADTSTSAPPSR